MQSIFHINIHGYSILFALWNILLAVIPCITVYAMLRAVGKRKWNVLGTEKGAFLLLFLFWLFFFPNTAYQFLTVRHLVDYCSDFDRYRVCATGSWLPMVFFVYASTGIPTFYYALSRMKQVIGTLFGQTLSDIFPVFMIPLTSIALLFGLYGRFNSWDVLLRPYRLITAALSYLSTAGRFTDFAVFTIGLYLIYYAIHYVMKR
jgi:uncharacterized membrane protein